jgi:putative membrane protein
VATFGALIGTLLYFGLVLQFVSFLGGTFEDQMTSSILRQIPEGTWLSDVGMFLMKETLGKALVLVLAGFAFSVVRYSIRYYGFRLTQTGDILSRSFGLITLRKSSLGRSRIQALKIEEGLLRRWFGLAAMRADSAGDRNQQEDAKKREVLVPIVPRWKALRLTAQIMPGLGTPEPNWKSISYRAVLRGAKKGWLLVLYLMLQTWAVFGWLCLIWLPAFPLVYFLNYQWYRNTGYSLELRHLLSRKGWLTRETLYLPIENIQNMTLSQNWFERRLQLATLSVDTAGQTNTGGGTTIRNLPLEAARELQHVLAHRVANTRFVW